LDVEVKDLTHVGRQFGQLGVKGPRLAALGYQDGPQGDAGEYLEPRNGDVVFFVLGGYAGQDECLLLWVYPGVGRRRVVDEKAPKCEPDYAREAEQVEAERPTSVKV
jgi:hypothetical protein